MEGDCQDGGHYMGGAIGGRDPTELAAVQGGIQRIPEVPRWSTRANFGMLRSQALFSSTKGKEGAVGSPRRMGKGADGEPRRMGKGAAGEPRLMGKGAVVDTSRIKSSAAAPDAMAVLQEEIEELKQKWVLLKMLRDEAAKDAGISSQQLSDVEDGDRKPGDTVNPDFVYGQDVHVVPTPRKLQMTTTKSSPPFIPLSSL